MSRDPVRPQDAFAARIKGLELKVAALLSRGAPIPSASRPDAAAVGVGTPWFDPTTNRPSWSTGTAWVYADGTPV